MPAWPATPRVGVRRPLATGGMTTRSSPASTNGDTVADGSMPATPADNRGVDMNQDPCASSSKMQPGKALWGGKIDLAGSSSSTSTPWILGSPDYRSSSDSGFGVPVLSTKQLTSVSTPETSNVVTPETVERGHRLPGSATSFQGSPGRIETDASGTKRKLIRKACDVEDPFVESKQLPDKQAVGITTNESIGTGSPGKFSSSGTPFRPRRDREIEQISSDNAQAVFPPHACVFVANLVSTSSDEQLQKSVEKVFSQFGKVYVKIKRDPRGMPFAFAQYENVEDSNKAISHGRGLQVEGRPCRTERAKVNRTLYLVRVLGGYVSEDEARKVLAGCGDLEKIWHCSLTEKEFYRLPEGIWVTFAFFQDARDAQSQFKDHPYYRLEQPEGPFPMRLSRGSPLRSGAIHTTLNLQTTVCISNLPADINSSQIREMFAHVGGCGEVEIVSRPTRSDVNGYEIFAFAEFSSESQAKAVCRDGYQIDEYQLRVEYGNLAEVRGGHHRISNHFGSPRGRRTIYSDGPKPSHREQCIARAMACGVNPATVLHILDGNGLGQDQLAAALHANYAPAFVPPFAGAFGSSNGGEAGNGHIYPNGAISGTANYPFAIPGSQFYSVLPSPYLFHGLGENARQTAAATGATLDAD